MSEVPVTYDLRLRMASTGNLRALDSVGAEGPYTYLFSSLFPGTEYLIDVTFRDTDPPVVRSIRQRTSMLLWRHSKKQTG